MLNFFRNLFKRKRASKEDFENIKEYLNDSENLNYKNVNDSRSTAFFKEASSILDTDKNEESKISEIQDFMSKNDEHHEEEFAELTENF